MAEDEDFDDLGDITDLGPDAQAASSSQAFENLLAPITVATDLGPAPPAELQQLVEDLRHSRIQKLERRQADLLLTWRELVPEDVVPTRPFNNKVKMPLPCIFFVAPPQGSRKRKADSPDSDGWDHKHSEGSNAGGSLSDDDDGVYMSAWNNHQGVVKRTGTIVGQSDTASCWTFLRVAVRVRALRRLCLPCSTHTARLLRVSSSLPAAPCVAGSSLVTKNLKTARR